MLKPVHRDYSREGDFLPRIVWRKNYRINLHIEYEITDLSSVISSFFSHLIRTCSITCHWHRRYQHMVLEKKLVMIFQPFNWLWERWYMYFHGLVYFIKNRNHCYHDENFKSRSMSYSFLTTQLQNDYNTFL